jgi:hypothetical protein
MKNEKPTCPRNHPRGDNRGPGRTQPKEGTEMSDAKIVWKVKRNPKREGSKAHGRFERYMGAKTVAEYLEKGGLKADLKYDTEKGFLEVTE